MRLDDDILVERAQGGDRRALDLLLSRHYDRIYAVCWRIAGNDADAADSCQEALLSIVKGLPRFDGRSKFTTWSHRVATNATLDEMRRKNRWPIAVDEVAEPEPTGPSPDQQSVDSMTISDALAQLPEEYRAPVVLRDLYGLDYADIADTLSIPPGTVRSRIARGRSRMGKILGNQNPSDGRHREQDD